MTKLTLRESEPRTRARPDESDVGDDLTRHRRDTVRQVRSKRVSFYADSLDFKDDPNVGTLVLFLQHIL